MRSKRRGRGPCAEAAFSGAPLLSNAAKRSPAKTSPSIKTMLFFAKRRAALPRAQARASREISEAQMASSGISCFRAIATAPDPVQRSSAETGSPAAFRAISRAVSRAASTRVSVSGRGMSTPGATAKSRPKNSLRPRIYATGSPESRRSRRQSKRRRASPERGSSQASTSRVRLVCRTSARSRPASSGGVSIPAAESRADALSRACFTVMGGTTSGGSGRLAATRQIFFGFASQTPV